MNQQCDYIDDFLGEKLGDSARLRFRVHLESCEACRSELLIAAELDGRIRDAWEAVATSESRVELPMIDGSQNSGSRKTKHYWVIIAVAASVAAVLFGASLLSPESDPLDDLANARVLPKAQIDSPVVPESVSPAVFSNQGHGTDTIVVATAESNSNYTIVKAFPVVQGIADYSADLE